jgi:amino acid adenylation domain-containing protein
MKLSGERLALLRRRLNAEGIAPEPREGIVPVPRGGELEPSFAQERLWLTEQMEPGSAAYHVPARLHWTGELHPPTLARALAEVTRRHEALRTTFGTAADGRPVQVIGEARAARLPLVDLSGVGADRREAQVRRLARDEAARPFDLARGPLLRCTLLRLGPGEGVVLLTLHHVVTDAWSMSILVREVAALYAAYRRGARSPLSAPPVQYADYAAWQRRWLGGAESQAQLDYWRRRLAGAPGATPLPTDRPRSAAAGSRGGAVAFAVPAEAARALRELARREGATPFMALMAGWQALLGRHGAGGDVVVGTPVSGRTRLEVEGLIGFFVNMLVIRTRLEGGLTFRGLLARVRDGVLEAQAHQDFPFDRLVEALGVERSLAHTPLFQVVFSLDEEAPGGGAPPRLGDAELVFLPPEGVAAKFDLNLKMSDAGGRLEGSLVYRAELFNAPAAERMARHFVRLLEQAAADPDVVLSTLEVMDAAERRRVLNAGNPPARPWPPEGCLHPRLERRAASAPDAVAVSFAGDGLTCGELNARANRLARRLRALGAGPDSLVGLCVEPSLELVIGVVAILKAGAAYLPLDPAYPPERLAYMAADAGIRLLVQHSTLRGRVPVEGVETVDVDASWCGEPAEDLDVAVHPANLAYVIYTSGSTGRPKGVAVTHAGVLRLFDATGDGLGFGAGDVWTLFHSFAFDFSVWEMWGALLHGGRLVVVPRDVSRDPAAFRALLAREGVTVLSQTPSAFGALARVDAESADRLERLRLVVFGGEALRYESLRGWLDRYGPARPRLVNLYGITETTVHVTWLTVGAGEVRRAHVGSPIGVPLAHLRTYVVDPAGHPSPVGVAGELLVGGAGLARGYLGRPALTAEKFVPDPFSGQPGARLYRSGDRARWTEERTDVREYGSAVDPSHTDSRTDALTHSRTAVLEYLGRADQQVKVRGFRIELGEIESALLALPGVNAAAVIVRGEGDDAALVGYVAGDAPSAAALREELRKHLPDYMVPAAFVVLERIPLTANGKVHRAALPAPDAAGSPGERHAEPRTATEAGLAAIWRELLRRETVSLDDDFFSLGGHSLLAARVVSRVRDTRGVELPLRAVFEAPTLEALARRIDELGGTGDAPPPPIRRAGREAPLPLSFAQQRLWFLDQLHPGTPAYNIPAALHLAGRLDEGALGRSLTEVVRRHEVLRTTFSAGGDGKPVQVIARAGGAALSVVDLGGLPDAARGREAATLADREGLRPFDLARGPLLRSVLLRRSPDERTLLVTLHHAVADGWSVEVLAREVGALYDAFARGAPSPLPEPPLQYADYAVWQREWLSGGVLQRELAYWRERLAGAPPRLALPADRPRPSLGAGREGRVAVAFPADAARALRTLARAGDATLFITLLAVFQAMLARWTGMDDVVVGSPVANRTRLETEGMMGLFANTLVLRGDLSGDPTAAELLARTREAVLGAQAHQDLPFERLADELKVERRLDHAPLVQVLFSLRARPADDAVPRLGGVRVVPDDEPGAGGAAKFDLVMRVAEGDDGGLGGSLSYRADLFDRATAQRMAAHFVRLAGAFAAAPASRLSALRMLDDAEREQVLNGWNDGPSPRQTRPVHVLVAEQAARTPGAPAVVCGSRGLTFAELEAGANRLARHLRRRGAGPETLVAVLLDRGADLVVAILATLKAGSAYLPLDPAHPPGRLRGMLDDSGARILLAHAVLAAPVPAAGLEVVRMDDDAPSIAGESAEPVESGVAPDNLAYVIYTSGSTGVPRGVAVSHRALGGYLEWFCAAVLGDGAPAQPLLSRASFDASMRQLFPPLLRGLPVWVLPDETIGDPAALLDELETRENVAFGSVPSLWAAVLDEVAAGGRVPRTVRTLLVGGEALSPGLVRRTLAVLPAVEIWNHYGPTEATVNATAVRVRAERGISLGRAVAGKRVYVLDPHLHPVPVGVAGELFIGGAGLARGYLGQPALTAARFVPDPFSTVAGARMYRSGDRVRWREERVEHEGASAHSRTDALTHSRTAVPAVLEFLGRTDQQVKLRGFRIEPGEVEAVLAGHPGVREAAVAVREVNGEPRLVAWVTGEDGAAPRAEALRPWARERLPDYMVPAAFVALDSMPLSPNGKVDRGALPAPGWTADPGGYVAPGNAAEATLAAIWSEVLRVDRVGVHDDFFSLGGDSLLSIQLVARARRAGLRLTPRDVFRSPTVAGQAAACEASADAAPPDAGTVERDDEVDAGTMAFLEQRLAREEDAEPHP